MHHGTQAVVFSPSKNYVCGSNFFLIKIDEHFNVNMLYYFGQNDFCKKTAYTIYSHAVSYNLKLLVFSVEHFSRMLNHTYIAHARIYAWSAW
jgi:hypothetical protein